MLKNYCDSSNTINSITYNAFYSICKIKICFDMNISGNHIKIPKVVKPYNIINSN